MAKVVEREVEREGAKVVVKEGVVREAVARAVVEREAAARAAAVMEEVGSVVVRVVD